MADILAMGQLSIVDLTDDHSLSCSISANMPGIQVYDPEGGGRSSPDWRTPPH